MAIYEYTLPSGNKFRMTVPTGTTQAQADKIFYEQVAAGTFVGYKKGDRLTHPQEAINEFGISRLKRGTAGVDDQTLLAVIAGLPLVAQLPATVAQTPVKNPINQTNYIQVNNSPTGRVSLPASGIGGTLTSQNVTALQAGLKTTVNNPACNISQEKGVGSYGFNAQQLEQAGYIKPTYSERFCPLDASTGTNPSNFVEFMKSPVNWTGKHRVFSVNDILCNQALQNSIQEELMNQSYEQLVVNGTIVPPTPPALPTNDSQVYNSDGTLLTASALTLLSFGLNGYNNGLFGNSSSSLYNETIGVLGSVGNSISNAFSSLSSINLGDIPVEIENLGANAIASFSSGLSSLSSGAVGFATNTLNSISTATGNAVSQLSGLATGLANANVSGTIADISSTVSGDIGALITTGSKYGTELASAWANSATSAVSSIGSNLGSLASNASETAQTAFNTAQTSLTSGIDSLAKSSQFSVNFSDFNLSSMVAGVQPAAGYTNTVDRAVVDAAVDRVIGSPLIAPPTFGLPSPDSLGVTADINAAKKALAQAQSAARSAVSSATKIV
jgi:hypothetical protein